ICHAQRGASGDRDGSGGAISDWRANLWCAVAYLSDGGAAFGSGGGDRRQSEGAVVDCRAREKADDLTESMDHNSILLLCVLASVVLLIFLIAVCKLHAFVALTM